jgi:hypothetical protein
VTSQTNEVRVEDYQSITLTSIPEPKESNGKGMQSEEPDIELMLSNNVVGDVMEKLVWVVTGRSPLTTAMV